ncbi:hypothetical protein ACFQPG_07385 [Sphingomonas sp. GCM10030256]|uniref:hypothetical protein n=1 Tax=Sphingomonas sp. GCM10030256 TaxID=3273427 RepID=UPI003605D560
MLFYFPTEIKLPDLPAALTQWLHLLHGSPLDAVSQLQISVLGWKGDNRYELRGSGGFDSYIIFDRSFDAGDEPLREWVPRLSSKLFDDEAQARSPEWFERPTEKR